MLQETLNSVPVLNDPRNIFDPASNPFPPIFRLGPISSSLSRLGIDIYPIPLYTALMPNMKAAMALHMIQKARSDGRLAGIHTLVEASSGNTLLALALVAPYVGITNIVAVGDRDVLRGPKRELLEFSGVSKFEHPEPGETAIEAARRLGKQPGWLNLDQYSNFDNPESHFKNTGPHVWNQTGGKISVFCASLGTTGTIVGTSKFLRSKTSRITIVGAACLPNNPIPGARPLHLIEDSFSWRAAVDAVIEMDRYTAYKASLSLNRAGNLVGLTSGLAYAAIEKFILDKNAAGELKELQNEDGRVVAGFACGDTAIPYLDKFSTVLDGPEFDPIQIKNL
jgi:cysteine synthase B